MLVPPPPPTIPAAVHIPFISGVPAELMSEADLKHHRDELAVHLAKASREAAEQETAHKERGERAVLFDSLYKEGVVSRRELENAQRDVRQGEEDLTDARLKVTDLELELKRTDARLKELAAQKQPRTPSKKRK